MKVQIKKLPTSLFHGMVKVEEKGFIMNKIEKNIQRYTEETRTHRKESRLDMARAREVGENSGDSEKARDRKERI